MYGGDFKPGVPAGTESVLSSTSLDSINCSRWSLEVTWLASNRSIRDGVPAVVSQISESTILVLSGQVPAFLSQIRQSKCTGCILKELPSGSLPTTLRRFMPPSSHHSGCLRGAKG